MWDWDSMDVDYPTNPQGPAGNGVVIGPPALLQARDPRPSTTAAVVAPSEFDFSKGAGGGGLLGGLFNTSRCVLTLVSNPSL
jgi:hypothetical protein